MAEVGNRMIGSVSLIPSPIKILDGLTDRVLDSCLLCKAMVHPEFRRQGIFSSLVKNAQNLLKDEGFDLMLTFSNNPYSYKSFLQAGFIHITDIRQSKAYISGQGPFKKYIAILPEFLKQIIGFPFDFVYSHLIPRIHHNYLIRYENVPDCIAEINEIQLMDHSHSGICGVRTPPFIRWRFSYEGVSFKCLTLREREKLLAYLIVEYPDTGKNALIGDLFTSDGDESLMLILVNEAVSILKKEGFDSVSAYYLKRTWNLSRIFSFRNGFISRSSEKATKSKLRFLYFPLKTGMLNSNFSDKNRWNIQSADTCLFWVK